jgi:hypothetical protein
MQAGAGRSFSTQGPPPAAPCCCRTEISKVDWFGWDELPLKLAPPGTLTAVLAAARVARLDGGAVTSIPDKSH